jgi:hypothetical protein
MKQQTKMHSRLDTFGLLVATVMTVFTVFITLMPLI